MKMCFMIKTFNMFRMQVRHNVAFIPSSLKLSESQVGSMKLFPVRKHGEQLMLTGFYSPVGESIVIKTALKHF